MSQYTHTWMTERGRETENGGGGKERWVESILKIIWSKRNCLVPEHYTVSTAICRQGRPMMCKPSSPLRHSKWKLADRQGCVLRVPVKSSCSYKCHQTPRPGLCASNTTAVPNTKTVPTMPLFSSHNHPPFVSEISTGHAAVVLKTSKPNIHQ